MKMSLPGPRLLDYCSDQLKIFFPDKGPIRKTDLRKCFGLSLERAEYSFSKVSLKYFRDGKDVTFNHLHSDQYAMFLYIFANTLFKKEGDISISTKLFLLNKCLHGIDAFYDVNLPEIFLFVHPIGTVLGRGTYGNYFVVYQRCGIGSNHDVYPVMKEYVTLRPGSSILGNCHIEKNCTIAAGSLILDKDLRSDSVYIGNPRDHIIRKAKNYLDIWRR